MIFISLLTLLCIWLCFECYKLKNQTTKLKERSEKQQDNNKFFIKQIDHYLEETNRLSTENACIANENSDLSQELSELKSKQQSKSVRLGQISEQAVGLLPNFPFDIKEMRFLGSPIDFIAFDFDNEVIHFIEVKTGKSKLNDRQKIIRRIVSRGTVKFSQITITETGIKYEDDGDSAV